MDDQVARAEALIALRRFVQAEQVLRSTLVTDPGHGGAMSLLALALLEQDKLGAAVDAAEQAVRLSPGEGLALVVLADVRRRRGDHDLALEAASAAVRTTPDDWAAHYTRAHVLLSQPDPDGTSALSDALEAVRLAPHESEAHNMLGMSYAALDRSEAALAAYESALQLDPTNSWVLNNVAVLGLNRGQLTPAAQRLRSGLVLAPQSTLLQKNFDVVLIRLLTRLFRLVLLLGSLEAVLTNTTASWSARAVSSAVGWSLVLLAAGIAVKSLPRGSSRIARGLWRRSPRSRRMAFGVWSTGIFLTFTVGMAPTAVAQPISLVWGAFLSWIVVSVVGVRARRWARQRP